MSFTLRAMLAALCLGAVTSIAAATLDGADTWLVSPLEAQDYQGAQGFAQPALLRAKALVPVIDILQPEPTAESKVRAPFSIVVRFKGQPDAEILPASFKVLYGALRLDITGRITKYVNVSSEGFALENAKIPVGRHRLILQIADDKQRLGERELKFEVE